MLKLCPRTTPSHKYRLLQYSIELALRTILRSLWVRLGTMDSSPYHLLPQGVTRDARAHNNERRQRYESSLPPWAARRTLVIFCGVVACLVAIVVVGVVLPGNRSGRPESMLLEPETCGESVAEARSLGCVFDVVLLGWVPWRCHNHMLATQFLNRGDWTFSRDRNGTVAVDVAEFARGEWDTLYGSHEFYILNCAYTWRKVREAAMVGDVLDGYLADRHQTNHCEMMMLRRTALKDIGAEVYAKFVSCPTTRMNLGRFGWYRVMGGKRVYRQP